MFRRDSYASRVDAVRQTVLDRPLPEVVAEIGEASEQGDDPARLQIRLSAAVDAAFAAVRGFHLYDTQLHAGLAMADGCVVEMATGEGKTYTASIPAAWFASAGRGTHVVTANLYLVQRDADELRPIYEALGLTVAALPEHPDGDEASKRAAYAADITYGTGHEFGFDFLRDRLGNQTGRRRFADRFGRNGDRPIMRSLRAAVIDEIDHVLLDDALSPLVLSEITEPLASDAPVHVAARELALSLPPAAFVVLPAVALTAEGLDLAHDALTDELALRLLRPWTDYVRQALHAEHRLREGVDFLIGPPKPRERGGDGDPEIQLIDASTGRIFEDRTWSDGLHQAVETKTGLPIRGAARTMARITKQRLFGTYRSLCGMTGTAAGCDREFRTIYSRRVESIPLRTPSRRVLNRPRLFSTAAEKFAAIAAHAAGRAAAGQPVLIGTASIETSAQAAEALRAAGIDHRVLDGRQDADEADLVAAAGQAGQITVATNLAGRGTDIKLSEAAAEAGGLHVVVAETPVSSRVQRQLIGRSARQGDPGSAGLWLSAEDAFLRQHGPWMAASIVAGRDVTAAIGRLQRTADRTAERQRIDLWRRDRERDDWLQTLARSA